MVGRFPVLCARTFAHTFVGFQRIFDSSYPPPPVLPWRITENNKSSLVQTTESLFGEKPGMCRKISSRPVMRNVSCAFSVHSGNAESETWSIHQQL